MPMAKLAARLNQTNYPPEGPSQTEPARARVEPAASASARECAHSASANVLQPHATPR